METSTFDPYLLITRDESGLFGIVGIQTNDTLILGDNAFIEIESIELEKAKLVAKPAESLTVETPLLFNRCKLLIDRDSPSITLLQKGQGKRLGLINFKLDDFKQTYLKQRA